MMWLWANSFAVCEGKGMLATTRRIRFLMRALVLYDVLKPMINAPCESSLGKAMASRPEMVGAVIWPYQCLGWGARVRLARIRDHYSVVDHIGGAIDFPVEGKLVLLDLAEIREGLHVVLDQPKWFMREGQLAINLFLHQTRLYSLVFSLGHGDDLAVFVGAIQGRDLEGILNEYRVLTKAAHGMRPRDLLIELFRMFCATLGIRYIFAVADAYRQHRSSYYGEESKKKLNVNYDEIWEDRGGIRTDRMFFQLHVDS